jgi:hypothetical protein
MTPKLCPICGKPVEKKYTYCPDGLCRAAAKAASDAAYRARRRENLPPVPCGCGLCGLSFQRRHSKQRFATACPNKYRLIEDAKNAKAKALRHASRAFDPKNNRPGGGHDKKVKFIAREMSWIDNCVIQIYAKALRTGNKMDLQNIRAINKHLAKGLDRCVKIFIQTRMMAMMKREPSRVHLWPLKPIKEMGV